MMPGEHDARQWQREHDSSIGKRPFMYERFTDRARKVMQLANQEAQRFNHEYIGTEHVLLGLIKEGSGVAANVLKNLDIDLRKIRMEVEKLVQSGPDMVTMGKLPQTPRAKKVIEYSMEEARNLNHNYVGTEHILLGLLREQEGVAAQVLMNLGLKLEDVREEVLNLLGHGMDEGSERSGMGGRADRWRRWRWRQKPPRVARARHLPSTALVAI
jgi:ATP-dependent Clp protease ATP-binding subunit ClpC